MQGEATRITLLIAQTLEQIGIRYAVGGSLASSLYGVMRSTLDVNILADMKLEHVHPLVGALSEQFYMDDRMMRDAINHQSSFNLIHYETAFKVDVFICKQRGFDRMQLERRNLSLITSDSEQGVYVVSPEDIILAKLEWYQLGHEVSDRQWRDILGVLKIREGELDLGHMHEWASELGVADLLERALHDAAA